MQIYNNTVTKTVKSEGLTLVNDFYVWGTLILFYNPLKSIEEVNHH